MSYEARPHNPNRNCVTRSGNTGGHYPTDRHPSDASFDVSTRVIVFWLAVFLAVLAWRFA